MIEALRPSTPDPAHPAKAVAGSSTVLSADIYREGHDRLEARALWKPASSTRWTAARMRHVGNDRWEATIVPERLGLHEFKIEAGTDLYGSWVDHVSIKHEAGQKIEVELEEGAQLLTSRGKGATEAVKTRLDKAAAKMRDASKPVASRVAAGTARSVAEVFTRSPYGPDLTTSPVMTLWVDRVRASVGTWYEMFPRSEGGFKKAEHRLEEIAAMGFDVLYLPPIHPIGHSARKGKNNSLTAGPDDPGSPWAIGSELGGHTAIHPDLGTLDDFKDLVKKAAECGLEVALDYALQCSPDHPWVTEHPEWFFRRPDGSVKYAENPPKKYQDIFAINFWPETGREALWRACREVLEYWIDQGIRLFRVDNPHTKPLAFWEWLIDAVRTEHPDVVFLAEAFTRSKMMAKLAEVGFSQGYTYFTWRNTKQELTEYMTEVALGPKADYIRPNFWPNTPDILAGDLRGGAVGDFKRRLLLAATLSPSYGIYSGYELFENQAASDSNEEYLDSEKYEIKTRDWQNPRSLAPYIARVNDARKRHRALQRLDNLRFHWADNQSIIVYSKVSEDLSDVVLVVVNLNPHAVSDSLLWIDLGSLGLPWDAPYEAFDEITQQTFVWTGAKPYVRLDPAIEPAHLLSLKRLT